MSTSTTYCLVAATLVLLADGLESQHGIKGARSSHESGEYERLEQGYRRARARYLRKLRDLASTAEYRAALEDRDRQRSIKRILNMRKAVASPRTTWLLKFQAAAKNHRGDDRARFLIWIAKNAGLANRPAARSAVEDLVKHHIRSTIILKLLEGQQIHLAVGDWKRVSEIYGEIIRSNPHRIVRAQAYYARALMIRRYLPLIVRASGVGTKEQQAKKEQDLRKAAAQDFEKAKELAPKDSILALQIEGPRFDRERLQVGMKAPDIVGQDVDGVTFRLSDYRGKAVLLSFWGDW